jgi:hypothetical protein
VGALFPSEKRSKKKNRGATRTTDLSVDAADMFVPAVPKKTEKRGFPWVFF